MSQPININIGNDNPVTTNINEPLPISITIGNDIPVKTNMDGIYIDSSTIIGDVSTLPTGVSAYVTNSGTKRDVVLNFGIPTGPVGPVGPVGPKGDTGYGAPIGGLTNQLLAKNSNSDYDYKWEFLTKSDVGLENVQNVDTTNPANIIQNSNYRFSTDIEKNYWNAKVSTTTLNASLSLKVDKVTGKGLSTNDLTDTLKSNYDTAYTNTHTHSNKTALDNVSGINTGDETNATIKTKLGTDLTNKLDYNGNGSSLTGLTKSQVGLSNVDNTSDINKPISTATQNALNLKVDKVDGKGLSTNDLTNELKTNYDSAYTHSTTIGNPHGTTAHQVSAYTMAEANALLLTKVPYTGAITSVNLGTYSIKSATEILDTTYTSTGTEAIGTTYWDTANHTTTTVLENGVKLQNGQEIHIYGKNISGSIIYNGQAVSLSDGAGSFTSFNKTDISNINNAYACCGVATQDIGINAFGYVTVVGIVNDVDTDSWNEGDSLYVSMTPGVLTNVYPTVPSPIIKVGIVDYKHKIHGRILTLRSITHRFQDLSDVNGTPLTADGQIAIWNNSGKYFDFNDNINKYASKAFAIAMSVAL